MTRSLKMLVDCQRSGLLSKKASEQIYREREKLLMESMIKSAAGFFDSGGLMGAAKRVMHGNPQQKPGFLRSLLQGGLSTSKNPDTAWSDVASNMGKLLAVAGLTAGTLTGAGLAADAVRGKIRRDDMNESFEKVLMAPSIQDAIQRGEGVSKDSVRRDFDIIATFAPSLAKSPDVATALISGSMYSNGTSGMSGPDMIQKLTAIQASVSKAKHDDRGSSTLRPMDFVIPSIGA